jgi:hypothetical protein
MLKIAKLLLLLFWFSFAKIEYAASQNQSANWYFGYQCGLNFMTSPPTILTSGRTHNLGGSASVSDNSGNLLFYTTGDTVWTANHNVMQNGTGLNGQQIAANSPLIVPSPGNTSLYYIFTTGNYTSNVGLQYSIVNMSLAAGQGSVVSKNTNLLAGPLSTAIAATRHCNGRDIWIVVCDTSNIYYSMLLTSSGFGSPVISTIGKKHFGFNIGPKINLDGNRLACAFYEINASATSFTTGTTLFDFDNSTGVLSNSITLITLNNGGTFGPGEFSPDGSKFYVTRSAWTSTMPYVLYQFDLCVSDYSLIPTTQYTESSVPFILSLQLAKDGKIYGPSGTSVSTNSLCVISSPNAAGAACNFQNYGQGIVGQQKNGMPSFFF